LWNLGSKKRSKVSQDKIVCLINFRSLFKHVDQDSFSSLVLFVVQAEELRRGTTKIALRMCHVFSVAFPMMPTFLK
jgi:hypothetical protein